MPENTFNQTGHQQLTVSNTAVSLTPSPAGSRPMHALIYVGTDAIRWRADGTAPTAAIGILVPAGGYIDWTDPQGNYLGLIARAQFIRVTTDATLDIAYMT